MAKTSTFQCTVITPEHAVLECDATSVVFPAHDGELGVLVGRAPLVCKMGIGSLRIQTADGEQNLFVDGGFAQVNDNHLTLLTEQAKKPKELDAAVAQQSLVEARAMSISDEASYDARTKAITRAQVQLKLCQTSSN